MNGRERESVRESCLQLNEVRIFWFGEVGSNCRCKIQNYGAASKNMRITTQKSKRKHHKRSLYIAPARIHQEELECCSKRTIGGSPG